MEGLIRRYINHVSKVEFLRAFRAAFFTSFKEDNIRAGFRGTGLVPLDPQAVLSKLDAQLDA